MGLSLAGVSPRYCRGDASHRGGGARRKRRNREQPADEGGWGDGGGGAGGGGDGGGGDGGGGDGGGGAAPPSPALRSQPSPKTLRPSRDAPSAPLDLSALPEDVSDEEAATLQAMRDYIRAASVVKLAKVSRR